MRGNPVFEEGVRIYLIEGHGLLVYFYLLLILASVELLTLFLPSVDPQSWMAPAHLLRVSSVTALILVVYIGLRVANQEFVPWRFLPLKRWLDQEGMSLRRVSLAQFSLLLLHAGLLVLLCSPLLIWAGSIARANLVSIGSTLMLLLFYSLAYGVWGLAAVALWERRVETREVFIRCFFVGVLFFSALLYLPLSPVVFLLYYLGDRDMAPLAVLGWQWPAPVMHFLFHFLLFASGLLVYQRALKKEAYR